MVVLDATGVPETDADAGVATATPDPDLETLDDLAMSADDDNGQPEPFPAPSDEIVKIRQQIAKLKEKEAKAKTTLNDCRKSLDHAYLELGREVATYPDLTTPAPTVKIDKARWVKAPIAMLRLPPVVEKILVEANEIKTVGQLAEWLEANGTIQGLEGITERRGEKVEAAFTAFIQGQK